MALDRDGNTINVGNEYCIVGEVLAVVGDRVVLDTKRVREIDAAGSGEPSLAIDGADLIPRPAGGGGVTDHGALTGLGDDDHTQYHNDARGDARYQPLDALLTAVAALTTAADKLAYFTGVDTVALADFTSAARTFCAAVDASAQRTALGLGTASQHNVGLGPLGTAITSDRLIGRDTASAGAAEELTVSGGVEFSGAGGIRRSALTGDVTASAGSNSTTIANNVVTMAKLADLATDTLIGRDASGTGDPAAISLTNGLGFTGSNSIGINNQGVTYARMQNVSDTDKLLGRSTAGAGSVEEIACTAAGRALLDDTDAAAQRTTLGLGTAATRNIGFGGTDLIDLATQVSAFAGIGHTHDASGITSGTLGATRGGTGVGSFGAGGLLYANGANSWAVLGIGGEGQVLRVGGSGLPEWTDP